MEELQREFSCGGVKCKCQVSGVRCQVSGGRCQVSVWLFSYYLVQQCKICRYNGDELNSYTEREYISHLEDVGEDPHGQGEVDGLGAKVEESSEEDQGPRAVGLAQQHLEDDGELLKDLRLLGVGPEEAVVLTPAAPAVRPSAHAPAHAPAAAHAAAHTAPVVLLLQAHLLLCEDLLLLLLQLGLRLLVLELHLRMCGGI